MNKYRLTTSKHFIYQVHYILEITIQVLLLLLLVSKNRNHKCIILQYTYAWRTYYVSKPKVERCDPQTVQGGARYYVILR